MFETKNLIIKKGCMEDAYDMHVNIWSQEESAKYMLWRVSENLDQSKSRIVKWLDRQKDNDDWFVYDKNTNKAIGFCGINKLDENNQALTGATFQLCSDSACNTVIATIDMTNDSTKEYKSLAQGTYYLKETVAPTGYVLPSAPTTVQIVRASSPSDGYFVFSITNTKTNFNLPFTGGRGVVVYAILGVSIITVASVYYTRKKKQA